LRAGIRRGKGRESHSGRTIPIFAPTKPHILAWLQRMATMLNAKDVQALDPSTPLFLSRVRNKDGSRRAIGRETAWRIVKGVAREHELRGRVGTHSTRKTLARKAMQWSNDSRLVERILGHKSLQSTECYLRSLTDREVWSAFATTIAAT